MHLSALLCSPLSPFSHTHTHSVNNVWIDAIWSVLQRLRVTDGSANGPNHHRFLYNQGTVLKTTVQLVLLTFVLFVLIFIFLIPLRCIIKACRRHI